MLSDGEKRMMTDKKDAKSLFHILPHGEWERAKERGVYQPESLETDGFIHCSTREQVMRTANLYFRGQPGLMLLTIAADQVKAMIRYEDLMGEGMRFPHIYGPLNLDAVIEESHLMMDMDSRFVVPDVLSDFDQKQRIRETSRSGLLTHLPFDLPGAIYRSPLPFSPLFDPRGDILEAYLDAGIDVVVMLTEDHEVWDLTGLKLRDRYQQLGLEVIHRPIVDFSVPSEDELRTSIQDVLEAAQAGKRIVIHCHAGSGRTGLFVACMAKAVFQMSGREAIRWVRQFVPTAIETGQQARFVEDFIWTGD
jgi:uncharacterized protein (DUF952 family)